jgi:UDPglucose 6-dehydrogenase
MQAVILVGGEGTRLRPLTSRIAKPIVTLVDRPFIAFMLEWLRAHGVTDVVLSCGFQAGGVRAELGDGRRYGVRLRYVEEPEPLDAPLVRTDVASAEMIKLAANAFLATKISFINEIANVCEETGANVREVARGVGLDGRIGPRFLSAGIGYGGSCFTKDVSALKLLAANSGYHFQLLGAVIEVNELQKRRVVAKLARHLDALAGKRIGLLGLSFKPNTDDMRGASSLVLASRLVAEGALVRAYDPVAADEARRIMPDLECAASVEEAVADADAVVLVTEWPQFLELDWSSVAAAMSGTVVIDGRNALDADAVRAAGLDYEGIGIG